ncbi:MAG: hypothetical protein NUV70_09035 [Caldiserica bacterium]|jgi:hypothetical protein|nr:hypothetical protein [Caldisericota bacterium]
MAKVYAPLMSIDASGTYANQLVYAKWKGIRYVRNHVIPMNPRTAEQMVIRNAFSAAVSQWHLEDQTTRSAWEAAALASGKPMSAFNLYVGRFVSWVKENSTNPPSPFLPTSTP